MELNGAQFKQLQDALASAFPTLDGLRMFVTTEFWESRAEITLEGNPKLAAFHLLEWAVACGRWEELVEQAYAANPGNPELRAFAAPLVAQGLLPEAKIQRYLRAFLQEMEERLAEMLSLSSRETPSAVTSSTETLQSEIRQFLTLSPMMPGRSRQNAAASVEARLFDNFPAAFEALQQRVLLLGAPGAGKTTTLLQFACTAAKERMASRHKPLPLFVPIHRWDQKSSLVAWMQSVLPGDIRLEGCSLLYLFDGLDELGGERPVDPENVEGERYDPRLAFLEAVDVQLKDAAVVISCREQDYQQIGTKAALEGAVTLLPLEADQIEGFLRSRNQSALWTALTAEANLLELMRTPLLLAVLSMALGEGGTTETLNTSQITAGAIFDFYITQRFAHEARKRILSFDEQQTRKLLGQIAASMWAHYWFPATEVNISTIEKFLGTRTYAFLELAQEMHFIRMTGENTLQFIHLKFRDRCALTELMDACQNTEVAVRRHATDVLGQIGDPAAIPALVQLLKDMDAGIRRRAADALGQIGDPATIPALMKALNDTDSAVRWYATDALGQIGDPATIPALVQALNDADSAVRRRAVGALGPIGDPVTIPALMKALNDKDYDVRRHVADALGQIGDLTAIPVLAESLQDKDAGVRRRATDALGQIGDPAAIPALMKALNDKDHDVRRRATDALGQIGDPAAIPALVQLLKDMDAGIRRRAADALGQIGDPATIPALMKALNAKELYVRQRVAVALSRIGIPAIPALVQALSDTNVDVRRRVADALGQIGDPAAIPALVKALNDKDNDVRRRAVDALGQIGDLTAIPVLAESLQDRDAEVRRWATDAINRITRSQN